MILSIDAEKAFEKNYITSIHDEKKNPQQSRVRGNIPQHIIKAIYGKTHN